MAVMTAAMGFGAFTAEAGTFKISDKAGSFFPSMGGAVESLARVEVQLMGSYTMLDAQPYYTFNGEKKDLFKVSDDAFDSEYWLDFSFVDINVEDGLTADGTYVLVVPADFIKDAEGNTNEAEEFTYTIGEVVADGSFSIASRAYSISPEPGEVSSLLRMEMAFEGEYTQLDAVPYYTFNGERKEFHNSEYLDFFLGETALDFQFVDLNTNETGLTEEGVYTVVIPAGFMKDEEGNVNAAAEFTYVIAGGGSVREYSAMMTPNSEKCFNIWTLVVEGAESIDTAEPGAMITITNPNGVTLDTMYPSRTDVKFVYTIDFGDNAERVAALSVPGQYTITVPAGMFLLDSTESDPDLFVPGNSPEFSQIAYLVDSEPEVTYELLPNSELSQVSLRSFDITFANVTNVELNEGAEAYLMDTQTNVTVLNVGVNEFGTVTLDAAESVTAPGTYTLHVSKGAVILTTTEGETIESPVIEAVYTVVSVDDQVEFATVPASGSTVKSFTGMMVTFPGAAAVTNMMAFSLDAVSEGRTVQMWDDFSGEGNTFINYLNADAEEVTEASVWTVTIPAGAYLVDGKNFQGAVITFTVDPNYVGVEGIETEDTVTVFNLQGIRLLDGADKAALRTLAPGLYIVNGKKVAISK